MRAHDDVSRMAVLNESRQPPTTAEAWLAGASDDPPQAHAEWAERGVAMLPLGRRFDAVRIPGVLVRAAFDVKAVADGPLVLDPHSGSFYALVPPQTTETWACAFGTCLGRGSWLAVPHPDRIGPPGPHWAVRGEEPSSLCTAYGIRMFIEQGRREVERATATPREPCGWCKRETGRPVAVGIVHAGSGGGGSVNACPACTATYRLVPLAEHPADSDGTPRYQPVKRLP